jgi:hypothetical protein
VGLRISTVRKNILLVSFHRRIASNKNIYWLKIPLVVAMAFRIPFQYTDRGAALCQRCLRLFVTRFNCRVRLKRLSLPVTPNIMLTSTRKKASRRIDGENQALHRKRSTPLRRF